MNLTPEQMKQAEDAVWSVDPTYGVPASVIDALAPVLFAAWQEQTAAQAGKNPYPTTDAVYAVQHAAWARGAAAGVAASETRSVTTELFEAVVAERDELHATATQLAATMREARKDLLTYLRGESGEAFIDPYYAARRAVERIDAALLSEEEKA